jgi:hypothetical protein
MILNILTDDWIDTHQIQLLNPNNFTIPTNNDLNSLSVGNLVKIGNKMERFWVKIVEINKDFLLGKIDNHLTFSQKYNYNDIVLFEKNNIYNIHHDLTEITKINEAFETMIKKKNKK